MFCASTLPITVCKTEDCEEIYQDLLGTDVLAVPRGSEERLQKWPALRAAEDITLKSQDQTKSCADVVLSSAGMIHFQQQLLSFSLCVIFQAG